MLFVVGNYMGFKLLQGDYSNSLVFGKIPLSDPFALLQLIFAGGKLGLEVILGAIIISVFYGVIGGRIFCSYVCPVNIITDLAAFLHEKIQTNSSKQNSPFLRNIRYYAFLSALILSFFLNISAFEALSPVGILQREVIFGAGFGITVFLAVFLFDLFVIKNGFCGHICPLGGFYAIIGRFSFLHVRYSKTKCTKCMKCKIVCPENQVLDFTHNNSRISSGECTRCGRCIEVCEDDALKFNIKRFVKDKNNENNID
jgi:ferredoxin-type protein NapH